MGDSWQWQLRGADGRWIKMGSRVRWLMRGAMHTGTVTGSPRQNIIEVRDDRDGRTRNLHTTQVTTVGTDPDERSGRDVVGRDGDPVLPGERVQYTIGTGKSRLPESYGTPEGIVMPQPSKQERIGTVVKVFPGGMNPTWPDGLVHIRPDDAPDRVHTTVPGLVVHTDIEPPEAGSWSLPDARGRSIEPGARVALVGHRHTVTMGTVADVAPEDVSPIESAWGRRQGGTHVRVTTSFTNTVDTTPPTNSHNVHNLLVIDDDDDNPYDRAIQRQKATPSSREGTADDMVLAFPVSPRLLQDQDGTIYKMCPRCGGTGHTFDQLRGGQCFQCSGAGWTKKYRSLAEGQRDVAKAIITAQKRAEAKEAKAKAKVAEARSAEPEGFEDRLYNAPPHRILDDLKEARDQYGSLTPNQLGLALRLLDELDAREAKKQERVAAGIKVPTGKQTVRGRVVALKVKDTPYGPRTVMTVQSPEGWRVWGTVPSSLVGVDVDDEIEFDATLEPSDRDETFGFFKRPTKGRYAVSTVTAAAGQSWRWQLRDRKGRWIEMGAEVKWLASGMSHLGRIIDSPDPTHVLVEDREGRQHRIQTRHLEVVGSPDDPDTGRRGTDLTGDHRPVRGRMSGVAVDDMPADAVEDMRKIAADLSVLEGVEREQAVNATAAMGVERLAERIPDFDMSGLPAALAGKMETAQDTLLALLADHHEQAMAVSARVMQWVDEYVGPSSPGVGGFIEALGMANPFSDPIEFLTQAFDLLMTVLEQALVLLSSAAPASRAVMTAAGDSWRWQLRDRLGRWIEMGAEVKWLAKGRYLFGIVVGSPAPGVATVEEVLTTIRRDIPSARLEVVAAAAEVLSRVERVRDEKGRVNWGALDLTRERTVPQVPEESSGPRVERAIQMLVGDVRPGQYILYEGAPWRVDGTDGPDVSFQLGDFVTLSLTRTEPSGDGVRERRRTTTFGKFINVVVVDGEFDVERDAVEPARAAVAALQEKYPEGVAQALLTAGAPVRPPEPKPPAEYLSLMHRADMGRIAKYKALLDDLQRISARGDAGSSEYSMTQWEFNEAYEALSDDDRTFMEMEDRFRKEHEAWRVQEGRWRADSREVQQILADVIDVGRQVRESLQGATIMDPFFPAYGVGSRERAAIEARRREYARAVVAAVRGRSRRAPAWHDKREEGHTLSDPIRPLTTAEKKRLTEAMRLFPKDWVDQFANLRLTSEVRTRGYNRTLLNAGVVHIAVDGDNQISGQGDLMADGRRMHTVAVHEIGHSMERIVKGLPLLEQAYWMRRVHVAGPRRDAEQDVLGTKMVERDEAYFPVKVGMATGKEYTLKSYTDTPHLLSPADALTQPWEVFTTGVQEVLGDGQAEYTTGRGLARSGTEHDRDLWDLTMGILLTLDARDVTARIED